jgi:alcohol dehydrogenase (nicotinoprotein)
MKTRTAVIYAPGEPIRVEEIELDPSKEHEVLVRMVAAGICHSDYHIISGEPPSYLPLALGHEGAGIIEEVGPAVTNCKLGDHVVLSFIPSCGHCRYCTSGHSNMCNMGASIMMGPQLDGTFRLHGEKSDIGQMCVVSTFSERSVVSDMSIVKVEDYYPLNRAVLVGCGVPTGGSGHSQGKSRGWQYGNGHRLRRHRHERRAGGGPGRSPHNYRRRCQ